MIRINTFHQSSYRLLLATTAMILFACPQGAAARGGGNSGDRGGMRSHDLSAHDGMMRQQSLRHRDRGDDHGANKTIRPFVISQRHRNYDKHGDKSQDHSAKSPLECIKAPCSRDVGDRDSKHDHRQAGDGNNKEKAAGTSVASKASAVPGTAGNNTIHPIVTSKPGQPAADAGTGKLPPNDPVGNTHPMAGSNPPTAVSVSNGVTTSQIRNGPGGVVVYSEKPGTITVDNGKERTTLNGGSVTLSGNVVGVGRGEGVEVGPRNAEGKTVVAIKPTPEPSPAGTLQRNDPRDVLKCLGCDVLGGVADFGYGIAHGFAPGPVPPPKTSTTTQE